LPKNIRGDHQQEITWGQRCSLEIQSHTWTCLIISWPAGATPPPIYVDHHHLGGHAHAQGRTSADVPS
jgi:hypothetical protein